MLSFFKSLFLFLEATFLTMCNELWCVSTAHSKNKAYFSLHTDFDAYSFLVWTQNIMKTCFEFVCSMDLASWNKIVIGNKNRLWKKDNMKKLLEWNKNKRHWTRIMMKKHILHFFFIISQFHSYTIHFVCIYQNYFSLHNVLFIYLILNTLDLHIVCLHTV